MLLGRSGGDNADVAAAFREAIRLRPDFAEAHNHLGLVLMQGGDDAAGIAALREAVRLAPDYAEARTNLGAALTPTDARRGDRELEAADHAGADRGQGALQPGDRLRRQPDRTASRRRSNSSAR